MRVLISFGLLIFFAGFQPGMCEAQAPAITSLRTRAVIPGQPSTVEIRGTNLSGAKQLWTSFPAQTVLAQGKDNGKQADRVTFVVTTSLDTPAGIHGIRVLTDKGASRLEFLLVDELTSVTGSDEASSFATAQKLELPIAVDGSIPNLGTRYFKFDVEEGQRVSFEVLARRLGETLDPVIRLLDQNGRELAFCDDASGQCGDSQICHTFAAAGEYLLEIRDVRYQGGQYRLRIGDFPCVSVAYPLAVTRDRETSLELAGISPGKLISAKVKPSKESQASWLPVSLKYENGTASGFSTVAVVDRPQFLETEPNNTSEQANRVEITHDINGRLEKAGDEDHFIFRAEKNTSLIFSGMTRTQGSPTDLVLKVLKADGSQLATVDDTGVDEGSMTVKFPEDGDYILVASDLGGRGGRDHAYRVQMTAASPSFSLTSSVDTFNVPAGGSTHATVTAKRSGYNGPIELSFTGLPEGVTASKSVIGPGRTEAMLTLTASPTFAGGTLNLVRLIGSGNEGAITNTADFSSALKTRWTSLRYPPAYLIEEIAVTGTSPAHFRWRAEPAEAVLGKQLSTKVKLVAERDSGFDDVIAIAVDPAKNGVPTGITVGVKNIDKGKNEVEIAVSADEKAPLGHWTVGLLGTLKKGKTTVVQPLALRVSVAPQLTFQGEWPEGSSLKSGGELELLVTIDRNPALRAPVEISLVKLPKGVTAATTTLPANESSVKIKLTAAGDADKGSVKNVQVKATATVGKLKFEDVSPNLALVVE